MPGRIGMDVGVVRGLATQIDQLANQVDGLIGSVEGTVHAAGSVWSGSDSAAFAEDWYRTHRPVLTALLQDIHALAASARTNATQQDTASSATSEAIGGPGSRSGDVLGPALSDAGFVMTLLGGQSLIKDLLHATKVTELEKLTMRDRVFGVAGGVLGLGLDTASLIHDLQTKGVGQESYNDEFNMLLDGAGIAAAVAAGPVGLLAVGALSIGADALEARYPWLTAGAMKYTDEAVKDVGVAAVHVADGAAHVVGDVGRAEVNVAKDVGHFVSGGVRAVAHLF